MDDRIKKIIDKIRPYLNSDGGDIEYVKYEDGYVFVKIFGACAECVYQDDTIQNGILELLKEEIPEIEVVININL